jgi:DNA-binding response OmpR family regulator
MACDMKILIGEDDPVDLQLLQLTLERMGREVVVRRTGTEAWETFDRAPVRIIVSDWMILGMDGLEFCSNDQRCATAANSIEWLQAQEVQILEGLIVVL